MAGKSTERTAGGISAQGSCDGAPNQSPGGASELCKTGGGGMRKPGEEKWASPVVERVVSTPLEGLLVGQNPRWGASLGALP